MSEDFDPDDHDGWDIARDGRMADYDDIPVTEKVERYQVLRDPVVQGKVPSPFRDKIPEDLMKMAQELDRRRKEIKDGSGNSPDAPTA